MLQPEAKSCAISCKTAVIYSAYESWQSLLDFVRLPNKCHCTSLKYIEGPLDFKVRVRQSGG